MTIAITVGHRESSQGAVTTTGVTEWHYNTGLAVRVQEKLHGLGIGSEVLFRPDNRHGVTELCQMLNAGRYVYAVELHFNSFGSPAATGCEVLHHHSSGLGMQLASAIQARQQVALGLTDRGLKPIRKGDRGWPLLSGTKMPAVIVEPFFGSNASDTERALTRISQLADAIARGIADCLDC